MGITCFLRTANNFVLVKLVSAALVLKGVWLEARRTVGATVCGWGASVPTVAVKYSGACTLLIMYKYEQGFSIHR